jgi:hypothetical protein
MVTSQDKPVIEAKLIKKKALKNSPAIEVGQTFIGHYFNKPKVGESFLFFGSNNRDTFGNPFFGPFQTSVVTKIIDENTFETKNSVYFLFDKVKEREMKIEDILK